MIAMDKIRRLFKAGVIRALVIIVCIHLSFLACSNDTKESTKRNTEEIEYAMEISQHGITWYFDKEYELLLIQNKIKAYQAEINNLYDQVALYQNTVDNYLALLAGEKRKFEEGESSLFVVNSRENSLINAEIKLIELVAKYQKAQAGLDYAIGGIDEEI